MKRGIAVGLIIAAQAVGAGAQTTELPKPLQGVKRIVMIGDSITQGGARPGGYVWLTEHTLKALFPSAGFEVINAGISGHKATDMAARLQKDVLDKIHCPVLIMHSTGDVAANPRASREVFQEIGSSQKNYITLTRSNHHILWDYERDQVTREVEAFLLSDIPNRPAAVAKSE